VKINKTVLVTVVVLLLLVGTAVGSFRAGVRYGNLQAQAAISDFARARGGPAGNQGSQPSPVEQMLHSVLGGSLQGIHGGPQTNGDTQTNTH